MMLTVDKAKKASPIVEASLKNMSITKGVSVPGWMCRIRSAENVNIGMQIRIRCSKL
jgi:hypothetical protein